jgi:hypothetical protein
MLMAIVEPVVLARALKRAGMKLFLHKLVVFGGKKEMPRS